MMSLRNVIRLYFKDQGSGQPIVFSHGWPLTADYWEPQILFFGTRGFRVIAHDRRGHGRSSESWSGNTMDEYADDLAELLETLHIKDAVIVGHSAGGGEIARYVGRHGTGRLAKIVMVGAVPPLMLKTHGNPNGTPKSTFDDIRSALLSNRSQLFKDVASAMYYCDRGGDDHSQGLREGYWLQAMRCELKAAHDCVEQFSEIDFTGDLRRIDVPTLVMHGDDDRLVPFAASAELSSKLIRGAVLKVYAGGCHGFVETECDRFNADLLSFIRA